MKKIIILFLVISSFFFTGCEEVITVDTVSAPPRLSVEAAINWQKGSSGNIQNIKLTATTGFFESKIPVVSGAVVYIKNSSNTVFNFLENSKTGIYTCSDFKPVLNETYTLTIKANGQTYTATETMRSIAPITKVVQNDKGGFSGKSIEVKAFYNDPADQENFYMYRYEYKNLKKMDLYTSEDVFFKGNEFFSVTQNDSLKVGSKINITHFGISKSYFNYMAIIIDLARGSGGGPFQSPPATIRGNVVNATDPENYPLGYFSVSEIDAREYIIQ
jgi:hypothetical protein